MSLPVKRQVTIGSWNPTTHTEQRAQCNDNAHITKLDFQALRYSADFPDPFPAGLRVYCSGGGSTPRSINWRNNRPTQGNVTTVAGVDSPDGIRDMIGAGDNYVYLLGYSTVVVGHAGGSLWQQQVQQSQAKSEFAGCKLVGVEALYVQWLDGIRLNFACPSPDGPSSTPGCAPDAASAASAAGSSTSVSPLSPTPLLVGIAIGSLGSLLLGLVAWTVIRRRQSILVDKDPQHSSSAPTSPSSPPTKHFLNKEPSGPEGMSSLTASPAFAQAHLIPTSNMQFHQSGLQTMATVSTNPSFPATLSVQPPMVYFVQAQPPPQAGFPPAASTPSPTGPAQGPTDRSSMASIPSSEKDLILP